MRLFIAINFSPDTLSHLLTMLDDLRSRSERGNFTHSNNLHLTLAFLGECAPSQTAAVKAAMDSVAFGPFEMTLDHVGRFNRDGGDIWWASGESSPSLLALQRDLTYKLTAEGFAIDKRKYSPHITLGREVVTDTVPWQTPPFGETVSQIDLMKSERMNGKLTYTAIYTKEAAK